jgi:hypothetical protein
VWWTCGRLFLFFDPSTGSAGTSCGSEVLWQDSQTRPRFLLPTANATDLYTLIVVDRDATSAVEPLRSPLRHFAACNVSGQSLLAPGLGPSDPVSNWFAYSGPRPPAGSGCHRYYGMAFRQNPSLPPPTLFVNASSPTDRLNWDFPTWAAEQGLEWVGGNYWTTQNADTRNVTGACNAGPQNGAGAAGVASAAALMAALGAALAAAGAGRREGKEEEEEDEE